MGMAVVRALGSGSGTTSVLPSIRQRTAGFPGEECGRTFYAVSNPSAHTQNSEIPLVPARFPAVQGALGGITVLLQKQSKKMPQTSLISSKAGET